MPPLVLLLQCLVLCLAVLLTDGEMELVLESVEQQYRITRYKCVTKNEYTLVAITLNSAIPPTVFQNRQSSSSSFSSSWLPPVPTGWTKWSKKKKLE